MNKPKEKPGLFSNQKAPGATSNYGQSEKTGSFTRNDLRAAPGITRAEKKAALRASKKFEIVASRMRNVTDALAATAATATTAATAFSSAVASITGRSDAAATAAIDGDTPPAANRPL